MSEFAPVQLGSLFSNVTGGGTPSRLVDGNWNGPIPWASVKDFKEGCGVIESTKETVTKDGLKNSSSKLIPAGTPLICLRMAVGRSAILENDTAINQDVKALFPNPGVSPIYVNYLLNLYREEIEGRAIGSTVKGISTKSLLKISVPFPKKIETQQKIAHILTTIDNLIDKTQILIDKYTAIKQGMMADLFTRGIDLSGTPGTNPNHGQLRPPYEEAPELYKQTELGWVPKEWEVIRLGDHISKIDSGWSPVCENEVSQPDQWAVLKTTAVVWSGYDDSKNKRLPRNLNGIPKTEVKKGDLLVTRKGPVDRVGVVVHVNRTRKKLMFPDTVFRFRVHYNSDILPRFLALSLASYSVQEQWDARKIGLAEAQVNLNHGIVNSTIALRPCCHEQQEIICKIDVVSNSIKSIEILLGKYCLQKKGFMQDLLTGKVCVQV